ncbi:electron transfer flavoprotein subunit alpha/FixB family protein [Neoactinobaculum massilliense]|uniref:electron transfer flavoprotein subunit alpha/FixB family protein n=1 Tax=Neoactinobaculum massilliense TaxID=2364794 RepID=UPI000F52D63A|nr:electron transfer flavoprotein subunit alpha/FixB family protein [Neoactinobaculum massilliense]
MSTYILVAGDAGIDNLLALAGSDSVAVVAGSREVADAVAASGVGAVKWLGEPGDTPLEAFAPAAAQVVAEGAPDIILATTRGADRVLLGAAAAKVGAPIFKMASDVKHEGDTTTVTRSVYGGVAQNTVEVHGPVALLMEPGAPATGGSAAVEEVAGAPLEGVTITERRPADHDSVDLTQAAKVVAVGRGLKKQEDLPLIQGLADALGAEVACSRPLAEGLDWFPHDSYVGVTGQHVSPDLYVAVGISGQLQHTVGARGAKTVVVINSDKEAPYVQEADYAIIGDLYSVVPALTAALK